MGGACEFVRKNQQMCKRHVAPGQRLCWQHGVRAWWRSLPALKRRAIFGIGLLGSLASIYGLLPKGKSPTVSIHTSGDNSPVVQDNRGSVTFNAPQPEQS